MRTFRSRWPRSLSVLIAAAVAVTSFFVFQPVKASAAPDTTAWYVIQSRSSGLVLDIAGASTQTGAELLQQHRTDSTNQQFRFVDSGSGYYRIQARHSNMVLDVWERNAANGATIAQYTDQNSANQQWQVQESGGYATFVNRFSGKALDVWEKSTEPGARISQYTPNGGANQQFQLIPVDDGDSGGDGGIEGCTGSAPIVCHFDFAPGTYDVTAVLGGDQAGSTVIEAETRRTMLGATPTAAGEQVTVQFTVNVRNPEGQPTGDTGSRGLDLYFGGQAPRLSDLTVTATTQRQLFMAGDSTVCDQAWIPYTGWGQELPQFFNQGLSVANYADSGESSGSFLANSRLFPAMRPLIEQGDVVLIQFGHNDKQTSASDFRANLTNMIDQVRAQGGTPVLVTPIVRRHFNDDGTLNNGVALHVNGLGVDLPAEMRRLAQSESVSLVDLTALTKQRVEELGPEGSKALYLTDEEGDNTHLSEHGATEYAALVIDELQAQEMLPADLFR
ncbi:RICIN domain-containing protein [Glycomyces arizonensis]|uniref:RICIN domain-containing protein n=1 Tax=Glycomyces arizonensis TaxID=256035 RepID=UPI0004039C9F|nr:RICIN domain-containing protein [Glycomyces arizonensis]